MSCAGAAVTEVIDGAPGREPRFVPGAASAPLTIRNDTTVRTGARTTTAITPRTTNPRRETAHDKREILGI